MVRFKLNPEALAAGLEDSGQSLPQSRSRYSSRQPSRIIPVYKTSGKDWGKILKKKHSGGVKETGAVLNAFSGGR